MSLTTVPTIQVEKVNTSRIHDVDFENLVFGNIFTDHMFECDYVDGAWQNPTIKPYGPLEIYPAAKVFHYGQAVFEGMKAYKDEEGSVFLFRPLENLKRINKSSHRMAIPEFPEALFFDAMHQLLEMDKDWVKPGMGNSLYIRPFVIATQNGVSASPSDQYKFMIILSPAQAYYKGEVRVIIAENFSRAADGGVGYAKAAGNYGAQFYPTNLAKERGFQQVIWTDANEHKYLEEAGTMNVFFRVNDTLLTAPTNDRILDGVTRKSVIALAEKAGINVEVRRVEVAEIVAAAKEGALKEIFGAGTAAVISPVSAFSYKDETFELQSQADSFAMQFKKHLMEIQYNLTEDPFEWRYRVC
ncbi:branched-chain amino acid aminotransferase [Aureisphaera galaxeae]|uniref:branched-chain amino acid aminotransferase n=1 Tax=Aureisphaera galaxeae TaxID=1538023 RepID=UPI002350AC95|nr:branched-chain amino acid aminotransferase [Aureisphaera galaxeae]MDC8006231.1 branched-chain amino acid aminotransferase [Aureisphaera galaxeae]